MFQGSWIPKVFAIVIGVCTAIGVAFPEYAAMAAKIGAFATALNAWFTRQNNVSSEEVGVKPPVSTEVKSLERRVNDIENVPIISRTITAVAIIVLLGILTGCAPVKPHVICSVVYNPVTNVPEIQCQVEVVTLPQIMRRGNLCGVCGDASPRASLLETQPIAEYVQVSLDRPKASIENHNNKVARDFTDKRSMWSMVLGAFGHHRKLQVQGNNSCPIDPTPPAPPEPDPTPDPNFLRRKK